MIRLAAALILVVLFGAPILGLHTQPWSAFWFGQHSSVPISVDSPIVFSTPTPSRTDTVQRLITPGFITDAQRYQLALAAGWSPAQAIIATAISIAENSSGSAAALSGTNFDGSRDLGLWQINSGWWPQFGGHDALIVPINNARAGVVIFGRQGWCAWSTYEQSCGRGHTGSYSAYLACARAISEGATCRR